MTNTNLLKLKIRDSGLKLFNISQKMGISRQTLWKKINNKVAFDQYEIEKLCSILGITDLYEKERIFFAKVVD